MLPTPAKFHYIFNLRDLSRIWEGILHVCAPECETTDQIISLWCHECSRVIADRFTNEQDCQWFEEVNTNTTNNNNNTADNNNNYNIIRQWRRY